jgi:molecular chaperone IbpA|tara:strand:+ start:341 stop:760 length:420 start_codon:yes stop_codon:yes gene_type:complete
MTNQKAFGQFSPFSVGFDEIFNTLSMTSKLNSKPNYPPYNIVKSGEDYRIEISMAGFKVEDIDVEVKDNTLTISAEQTDEKKGVEYIHKGISERDFYKSFALAEYVEVKDAVVLDGILVISLEKNIPEEEKPKKIAIKS